MHYSSWFGFVDEDAGRAISSIFSNSTNINVPYCLQHKIKILILISPVYPATFWLAVRVDWTVEDKKTPLTRRYAT